jgi:hypothetical protein
MPLTLRCDFHPSLSVTATKGDVVKRMHGAILAATILVCVLA